MEDEHGHWVAANLPRYALPNTTSLLPEYANAEAEFIHKRAAGALAAALLRRASARSAAAGA